VNRESVIAPELASAWRALLDDPSGVRLDLDPREIVVLEDGSLATLPVTLTTTSWEADDVFARDVLRLALSIAAATPPGRWTNASTVHDIVSTIGAAMPDGWIDRAIACDAAITALTAGAAPDGTRPRDREAVLRAALDRDIWSLPLGHRDHDVAAYLSAGRD
jgi:hypothetical protein